MKIINSLVKSTLPLFIVTTSLLFIYSCGLMDNSEHNKFRQSVSVFRIYSINTDGTNLKLLSNGSKFILSKTGDSIFYCKDNNIYFMNTDGTNPRELTSSDPFNNLWLSLNGKNICLNRTDNSAYFMNTDGSGLTKFNLPNSIKYVLGWNISPVDSEIVFSCNSGIYLITTDGKNLRLLKDSSNLSIYYDPNFTIDGTAIVYVQGDGHYNSPIGPSMRLFNLKNGRDTLLFPGDNLKHVIDFEVSPWNTILFTNTFNYSNLRISLLNLGNLSYTTLTQGSYAHFSIDGEWISYIILDSPLICTYNLKSKMINRINTSLPGNYFSDPRLTPDNKRLIFLADSTYYLD